mgnify:CR=1 FL=1
MWSVVRCPQCGMCRGIGKHVSTCTHCGYAGKDVELVDTVHDPNDLQVLVSRANIPDNLQADQRLMEIREVEKTIANKYNAEIIEHKEMQKLVF